MRFVIAMTDIEGSWDGLSPERQREILDRHEAFERELVAANALVDVFHLHPRSEARTVRMDDAGETRVSDGPFSDAREYVGGFYVIDARSLDEATEWARRGRFMVGANEVRQVWD